MKRPLIDQVNRMIARKYPNSLMAQQYESTIEWARFKRELERMFILPVAKWLTGKLK